MAAVALLAGTGALYQAAMTARDMRGHPPPGRMVDIGGYRMHLYETGHGGPTVVLDAGLGGSCLQWSRVQPEVAKFARVASFDRAGLGWSDASRYPRASTAMAEELHRMLRKAHVPGPYVLVGHSFGGWNARLFAARHPQEVAGVVLVDSPDENGLSPQTPEQARAENAELARERFLVGWAARLGLVRLYVDLRQPPDLLASTRALPERWQAADRATRFLPRRLETALEERRMFRANAGKVRMGTDGLGDLPLVVVSSVRGLRPDDPKWKKQERLARLSTRGAHVLTARSGHNIHLEEPELVVAAIRRVVEQVRKNGETPESRTRLRETEQVP